MADLVQSGQRNIYNPTDYKPDNNKNYHEDYIQGLSFNAADFPVQAQKSGKVTVAQRLYPKLGRKDNFGQRMDCGWAVDMQYDSLYPGNLQSKFGVTQSFKNSRSNQKPRLRPPVPNSDMKIPSRFVPDPSFTFEQTRTAAFGDTTHSFGPHINPLQCSPDHFTVPKPMQGHVSPSSGHYVPRRGTSDGPHLPTTPGTRRNLTPAKSEHEHVGNDALVKGNWKAAVKAFSAAIEADQRNPILYRNRAAAYAQLSQWKKAGADTQMVCQLMPNNRKAMVRHKAVCDYMDNFANFTPGSDRANLTTAGLLMPEEYTGHKYTSRLTTQWSTRPIPVPTRVDAKPSSFYEQGAPASEPLAWAKKQGSRGFWETQRTNPEARTKHRSGGTSSLAPGNNWSVNPAPTTTDYPLH
jgi:tetratricopeptide (TPR) repeat protein